MSEWIDVNERLPDEGQRCLAFMRDGEMHTCWATHWHGAMTGFAEFTFPIEGMAEADVTHWMPLPEPPSNP